jgi:hypothetical protein
MDSHRQRSKSKSFKQSYNRHSQWVMYSPSTAVSPVICVAFYFSAIDTGYLNATLSKPLFNNHFYESNVFLLGNYVVDKCEGKYCIHCCYCLYLHCASKIPDHVIHKAVVSSLVLV